MDAAESKRVKFEMNRRGFRLFTAAREFVRGWDAYNAYDFRTARAAFKRVTELDPDNPYGWAYMLFIMEDIGGYTVRELADVSERWCETAIKYRHQGQDALAMAFFTKYVKLGEEVEIDGLR